MSLLSRKQKDAQQKLLLEEMRVKLDEALSRASDLQAKIDSYTHLRCSFCGKNNRQVRKLIAGPSAFICEGCVVLCVSVLADDGPPPEASNRSENAA